MLSLAGPCFPNSSQFLLSLQSKLCQFSTHASVCNCLENWCKPIPHWGESVPGYTNRTARLLPPSKFGTNGSRREIVWTSCNTFSLPRAPRSPAGMRWPEVCSARKQPDWPSQSLDFTDAAWQSSSTSIWETVKEGLKSKQSKERFYSVPSTASYLHARRSPISGRIPFGSLGTRLGGFDHQRDRLKEKVIFCSACT